MIGFLTVAAALIGAILAIDFSGAIFELRKQYAATQKRKGYFGV